jgi:tetratricopeptide (TPR) repeat protein
LQKRLVILLVLLTTFISPQAQQIDISTALKQIEVGRNSAAEEILKELKSKNPNAPETIYLEASLASDGDKALSKYLMIIEKHSASPFVEHSLYKVFTYYYSLGYYKKAESYLSKLQTAFPESDYIKLADRKLPDIDSANELIPSIDSNKPAQKSNETYSFTIQAGAFLNSDNASKLKSQLMNDGFDSELVSKEIGGSVFNIIYVGKFKTKEDAEQVLSRLTIKYKITGRLVELNK